MQISQEMKNETRKSCTGYVIKLGNAIIAWVSCIQQTVVTATTAAEWTALYEGIRHGEFIRRCSYKKLATHLVKYNGTAVTWQPSSPQPLHTDTGKDTIPGRETQENKKNGALVPALGYLCPNFR